MKFKAVIFDLDGTLVHTRPEYRYRVVRKTLRDFEKVVPNHYIDRFWFEAGRDEIIEKHFQVSPSLFWEKFRKYDTIDLREKYTQTYSDIDFVYELRNDCKIGVVTGAPRHIAELEINMIGKQHFHAVVLQGEHKPKPHPFGIEKCLKKLGVDRNDAVFVGNSDEDIRAAKNAQVLDILVRRGEHNFSNIEPSLAISSLYELRELVFK